MLVFDFVEEMVHILLTLLEIFSQVQMNITDLRETKVVFQAQLLSFYMASTLVSI